MIWIQQVDPLSKSLGDLYPLCFPEGLAGRSSKTNGNVWPKSIQHLLPPPPYHAFLGSVQEPQHPFLIRSPC